MSGYNQQYGAYPPPMYDPPYQGGPPPQQPYNSPPQQPYQTPPQQPYNSPPQPYQTPQQHYDPQQYYDPHAVYPDQPHPNDALLHYDPGNTPAASTEMVHLRPGFAHRGTDSYTGVSAPSSPLIKPAPYYDEPGHAVSREDIGYVPGDRDFHDEPLYTPPPAKKKSRRALWLTLVFLVLALAAAGALVYFFVIRPKQNHDGSTAGGKNGTTKGSTPTKTVATLVVGRDGDSVKMENGTAFTYKNPFGGYFIDDPNDAFNNGAKAQDWSPALNETWDYSTDIIRGVNLGGWLVLEPFIAPALYDKYKASGTLDSSEWTLVEAMRADTAGGGIQQLVDHYATFITEKDFADIAGAGLNWVRLPIPYWTIEVWDGEPFLEGVAWQYALRAFKWARKYGLRVNLDLHTMPGSQNGWNHSGKSGPINWMNGVMGLANAQRSLTYMRIIVEFISQKEYKDVVPIFGIVNEPTLDQPILEQFYLEAYTELRGVTGVGAGNGPILSIHDHFNANLFKGFLAGADRLALDSHRYYAFDNQDKPDIATFVDRPCLDFGNTVNASMSAFGFTAGGEWSLGYNDCGLYVQGGLDDIHKTSNCHTFWDLYEQYPQATKDDLRNFALASMEGMHNFFFWTWKIGASGAGKIEAPLWSYQLGLAQGWMPTDPREAIGHCASRGVVFDPANAYSALAPTATGGVTTQGPLATATIAAWPLGAGALPSYTPTGAVPTLPPPTVTPPATATLNGWTFAQDTQGAMVPIAGCTYPDPWGDPAAPAPAACPS